MCFMGHGHFTSILDADVDDPVGVHRLPLMDADSCGCEAGRALWPRWTCRPWWPRHSRVLPRESTQASWSTRSNDALARFAGWTLSAGWARRACDARAWWSLWALLPNTRNPLYTRQSTWTCDALAWNPLCTMGSSVTLVTLLPLWTWWSWWTLWAHILTRR